MRADYGYSNARLRAMKSYLLDKAFYEQLIKKDSLNEVISVLEKTGYGKDIDEGLLKYPGAPGVEEGLRKNITRDFRKVVDMVDGEARELVGIMLGRWDVDNLKTVLRGKHISAPSEEIIESIIPAGTLEESVFLELVKQPELKACIDLLAAWEVPYARPLTEKFPLYAKYKSLPVLELALDKFYYEFSLQELRRRFFEPPSLNAALVREILIREIDFVNIMTLLKLPREQMKKEMEEQRKREEEELEAEEVGEAEKAGKRKWWLWWRKKKEAAKEGEEEKAEEAREELKVKKAKRKKWWPWWRKKKEIVAGEGLAGKQVKKAKKRKWWPWWRKKKKITAEGELAGKEDKKAKRKKWWLWWRKKKKEVEAAEAVEEETKREAEEAKEEIETEREKRWLTLETSFEPYFIEGGKELSVERLTELAEIEEIEDIIHSLRDISYWKLLNQGLEKYFETGFLSPLQRSMEEQIIRKSVSLFKGDPLSIAIAVAYIWAKFNEVVNLRIIVRGKSVEMPEERIREGLVLV